MREFSRRFRLTGGAALLASLAGMLLDAAGAPRPKVDPLFRALGPEVRRAWTRTGLDVRFVPDALRPGRCAVPRAR